MYTIFTNNDSNRFETDYKADASAGFRLEYAYQGMESSDSIESDHHDLLLGQADQLAAIIDRTQLKRHCEKYTIGRVN